jgi:adenylate cyclase
MTEPGTEASAALYRAVGLGPPRYRRDDIARLARVDRDRSVKWWRAMGFAEVPEDVTGFTEVDVEMVQRLATLTGAGVVDDEAVMRLARVLGASFSRIAEAQLAVVEQLVAARPATDPRGPDGGPSLLATIDEPMLGLMEDSLVYVWRRHLMAALGRRLQTDEHALEQAVGFADLSGFTTLSQRVSVTRLAGLVDEFEKSAIDVVSVHGGRVVKLIGDEVMYVASSLPVAVDIALDLAARLGAIADMPPIHCGIAHGPTVSVGGDVFGPAVNLAARLTTIARRGTIVVTREDAAQLADHEEVELVRVRRTVALKGIGDTRIVTIRRRDPARRSGGSPSAPDAAASAPRSRRRARSQ